MTRFIVGLLAASAIPAAWLTAQDRSPFKLGTFDRQGRPFVGVIVRDTEVVDLSAALAASAKQIVPPADMKDLIRRYDSTFRTAIGTLVASVSAGAKRPPFVHDLASLKILPPIMYPTTMLNVALNYREHAEEMAGLNSGPPVAAPGGPPQGAAPKGTTSAPGIWERDAKDTRWNPYMFLKSPAAVIAAGEAIRLPQGRTQIDWECELGVVIKQDAFQVPVARANDYIFGYTIENDVSDRGGRGDDRYGSDWLIGKSHDTFAPMGPFIVPKEFVADPRKLLVRFQLNGQLMQSADTSLMIHDVFEQVSYGSHIMTLRAGDVIATGSPAGVGSARKPPIFFKPGDLSVCTYEGVGTLSNPVVAASPAGSR